MFIYKITVNNKNYIGFDSHPTHRQVRWKAHCKLAEENSGGALHKEMAMAGIDACTYEVLESGFNSIVDLAIAEIKYIKLYDSKNNGLNSTYGGDGMNLSELSELSDEDVRMVLLQLSSTMAEYNTNIKWDGKTSEERKALTSHLHCSEVYEKKRKTLKRYYADNPAIRQEKYKAIHKWRQENPDKLKKQNRKASLLGAAKTSKKVKVILPSGETKTYRSKTAFAKEHGYIINNVIKKTAQGLDHKGYQGWEINE